VENQTDEMASINNNSGNSDLGTLHKDNLGRCSKFNRVKHAIEVLRNSGTIKFVLFREDFPKHRVIENITPLHAIGVFYICLFAGILGFMVLAYATFLGFIFYYAIVGVAMLEILHHLYDK